MRYGRLVRDKRKRVVGRLEPITRKPGHGSGGRENEAVQDALPFAKRVAPPNLGRAVGPAGDLDLRTRDRTNG
jgi:hypothetical protein